MVKKTMNKKKRCLVILGSIALTLVLIVIIGACTNWYGFYGPVGKIAKASYNTVNSQSFTLNGTIQTKSLDTHAIIKVNLLPEDRRLDLSLQTKGGSTLVGIYNDQLLINYGIGASKKDISRELGIVYDLLAVKEDRSVDWHQVLKSIDSEFYEEYAASIDFDKIDRYLLKFYRKANNDRWLKENAGFSQKEADGIVYYTFTPDLYKFFGATLDCFEGIFTDEQAFDRLHSRLEDRKGSLQKHKFVLCFGIQNDLLVHFNIQTNTKNGTISLLFDIDQHGNTQVDIDRLEKILKKCKS